MVFLRPTLHLTLVLKEFGFLIIDYSTTNLNNLLCIDFTERHCSAQNRLIIILLIFERYYFDLCPFTFIFCVISANKLVGLTSQKLPILNALDLT